MRTRTSVMLDKSVLKTAKHYAIERDQTLGAVLEEALREKFQREDKGTREPFVLVTHEGGKLQPGVDLENRGLLEDIMDGLVDPS